MSRQKFGMSLAKASLSFIDDGEGLFVDSEGFCLQKKDSVVEGDGFC